jgi:IclR family transcriptional regulator, KDG regulon repressor
LTDSIGEAVTEQRSSSVQSVERAIAILKSFSIENPERGVGEISRELGLHKSTVSRLMTTLERGGLLAREPERKRYRLGISLIGLAAQVVSYMDVREVARPFLRQLAEDCQESVNLVVLDGQQVVNLEQFIPPKRQVKNIGRAGRRMHAHCTAAGKVLLAYLAEDELDRILAPDIVKFTSYTITDAGKLRLELARVRVQGYAVAHEELERGLNAVAAPIYDHTGQVIAAAGVAGPAYRLPADIFPQLAAQLRQITTQISVCMGYKPG